MIEYYVKNKQKNELIKADGFSKGCWIHVTNPSKEETDKMIKEFNLDESSFLDGLDIHENPRFDVEEKKTYIHLTCPTSKIKHEHDSSFLIIYSKGFFITVSKYPLEVFDKVLNSKTSFTNFSSTRNTVKLLFTISRLFETSVHKVLKDTKTNRADLSILKTQDIEKLINYEDMLNTYLASFGATINTYSRILRDKSLQFLRKDEVIIEDLIIDLNETLNLCKETLRTISNMRTYYSTKLSNDLNKSVTLLTLATIFLSIPTLISSIYGMNINLPFQNNPNILFGLGVVVVLIFGAFIVFLRKRKMI